MPMASMQTCENKANERSMVQECDCERHLAQQLVGTRCTVHQHNIMLQNGHVPQAGLDCCAVPETKA